MRDLTVLNDATVISFAHDMKGTLLEIYEARVRHLHVRINCDAARRLISLIADELAADQVD